MLRGEAREQVAAAAGVAGTTIRTVRLG